jgi:hypothetical protein
MKYPTIGFSDASKYVQERRGGNVSISTPEPRLKGEGKNISHELHERLNKAFQGWEVKAEKATNQQKKDAIEGEFTIRLYKALNFLLDQPEVLTDRDFWRFVAIVYMYEFCEWRETRTSKPCSPAAWGADTRTIDRDCVPYRMFNRALVAHAIDQRENTENLKYSLIASGDLWKSHVLRRDISYSPTMTKCLLDKFEEGEINTTSIREPIKGIGRLHANIFYEVFGMEDSLEIWEEEINRQ